MGTTLIEDMYAGTYERIQSNRGGPQRVIDDLMFCPKCNKTYGYYRNHNRDATLKIEYFREIRGYKKKKTLCLKKYGGTCK